MIYKTLHKTLKIEQQELHYKPGAPKGDGIPAPLVAPVVFETSHFHIFQSCNYP